MHGDSSGTTIVNRREIIENFLKSLKFISRHLTEFPSSSKKVPQSSFREVPETSTFMNPHKTFSRNKNKNKNRYIKEDIIT